MAQLTVLTPADYFQGLQHSIPQAKKRVVIAAMIVLSGEQTDIIFGQLKEALQRGVTVRILMDNYTRLTFLYKIASARERLQRTLDTLKELKTLGARVYSVGRIGIVPYKGRCHIKISVVDDDVYSFGGVNFHDETLALADYMLHTTSAAYADCLEELVKRVGGSSKVPLANGEVEIDDGNTILFDGGKPNSSIIYDHACELAGQAARVQYISQMAPSGELAKLLHATNTTYYTNRPELMQAPDAWGQAFDLKKYRTITSYHGQQYLHAKFMLCEFANGRKVALTGSHNFSHRGVAYGTQEIALQSTDPHLWEQLHSFMRTHLATKTGPANS